MNAAEKTARFTVTPEDLDAARLARDSNCIFLSADKPGEKLSGGFYDQTYLKQKYAEKYDPYFAVTWILKGEGVYRDCLKRRFNVGPGDMLIRHAGTLYGLENQAGCWLEFSAAIPKSLYLAMLAANILAPGETLLHPGLSAPLLEQAVNYVKSLHRADFSEGRAVVYRNFMDFYAAAAGLSRRGTMEKTREEQLFDSACAVLGKDFEIPLDMNSLASRFGLSYETFRKKFVRYLGMPPNEYRIRKRLEKAESLLLGTNLSVKEIAEMLGYSELSVFTRQYTRFRHCPPRSVRKRVPGLS